MNTYTPEQILASLAEEVSKAEETARQANYELEFINALFCLTKLAQTTKVRPIDCLIPHYGESHFAFHKGKLELYETIKGSAMARVKDAISNVQSTTDTEGIAPIWAKQAKKWAKIIDEYMDKSII